VQAAILRLVLDTARRDADLDRFRNIANVRLPEGVARGRFVLRGDEYRIAAPDPSAARRRLNETVTSRFPPTIGGYEHDGVSITNHDLGPPPFLSTIEIMRRAVRHGLMPWETMEALQNLYLGRIMENDYLGEAET
jgi:hypothetical protein